MRHTKIIDVPATSREVFISISCDLCHAQTTNERTWSKEFGQVKLPVVEITEGIDYPDCSHLTTEGVHICPNCFREKLVPWLRTQGVELHQLREVES